MANPNQQQPITLADAFNYVNSACKRCDKLSMDEGVVLNASLTILRNAVSAQLAAGQTVPAPVVAPTTLKAAARKAAAKNKKRSSKKA